MGKETCFPFENTTKTTLPPFCKCATKGHTSLCIWWNAWISFLPWDLDMSLSHIHTCTLWSDRGINEENISKNAFPCQKLVVITLDQETAIPVTQAPCKTSLPVTIVHSGCLGRASLCQLLDSSLFLHTLCSPAPSCSHRWRKWKLF